jgi:hypothetical protein
MTPLDEQGNYVPPDRPRNDADVASAARTTTGSSTAFDVGSAESFEAVLTVSAASGTTPTLNIALETSIDNGATWQSVGAFAQKTGVATENKVFGPLGDRCRWTWTIGGTTPSFTFAIDAEANE